MEFQFGTNWARFSIAGGVIGQTLAMEGLFAFFLESAFLGAARLRREAARPARRTSLAALALFVGSWLSGYFIIATNAFMQHPVGHGVARRRHAVPRGLLGVPAQPVGARAVRAHHDRRGGHGVVRHGRGRRVLRAAAASTSSRPRVFLRVGTIAGLVSSVLVAFPTGDHQAKLVARAPAGRAGRDGRALRERRRWPASTSSVSPTCASGGSTTRSSCRGVLSFLAFGTFHADVQGLNEFPEDDWPDNIELLYYAFHVMVGLGTLFILLMGVAALLALARTALTSRAPLLWVLMLAFPFPYIANTAGWMTAELGRQPWLVYGLMRTADGASPPSHSGTALFTLIGFAASTSCSACCSSSSSAARSRTARPATAGRHRAASRRCAMVELWFAIAALMMPRLTSCSTASTSAPAPCTSSSRGPTPSGGRCSPRSARTGTATKSGCSRRRRALLRVPARARLRALGLLLRDLPRAVVADPARHLDRVPQPRRGAAVARGVGRVVCCRQHAAARALRRRARQPGPRRAARRRRLVLAPALHRLFGAALRSAFSTGTRSRPASSPGWRLPATARRSWRGRPTAPSRSEAQRCQVALRRRRDPAGADDDRDRNRQRADAGGAARPSAGVAGAPVAIGGLVAVGIGLRRRRICSAFLGSCAFLAGMLATTAAASFRSCCERWTTIHGR